MAYQTSPGISVTEVDLTTVVPAVSSTTGGIAGVFAWGPTLTPVLVTSEVDLVRRFGKPVTGHNVETFFTAADFLAYGNSLYVVRADTGDVATPAGTGSAGDLAGFKAKYSGTYGNSLKVQALSFSTYDAASNTVYSTLKGSSRVVNGKPAASDLVHIVVIDEDGSFTGVPNSVVEAYENVSLTDGAKKADGSNNNWAEVINNSSNYVKIESPDVTQFNSALSFSFEGGTNGLNENTITSGAIITAYNTLKNPEEIDVSLLMQGVARTDVSDGYLAGELAKICESRMDAIAFASPPKIKVLTLNNTLNTSAREDVISWADSVLTNVGDARVQSYLVLDSGYKYRYDRYNDRYVYTPLNGDVAGLCARTDELRDPWFSPAGYNRGGIKNIIKLAYNPVKTDRDELYKASVNPVITQPGQGTVLFGDKTAVRTASAFDRINVRRLFIVLEKAITRASRSTLFEFNDEFTRAQFRNLIEPFLRDIQGRRGIYDYKVVCDETNNTPEIIDRNEFVGDIYIKPARAINFIRLNFVAVRTGVEFEEIIGQR